MRRWLHGVRGERILRARARRKQPFARREPHPRRLTAAGTGVARVIGVASLLDAAFNVASQ
jgi:hypothetical protein